jgi:hypothetical protein
MGMGTHRKTRRQPAAGTNAKRSSEDFSRFRNFGPLLGLREKVVPHIVPRSVSDHAPPPSFDQFYQTWYVVTSKRVDRSRDRYLQIVEQLGKPR